ncbi:MAG: hypothetical protein N4J56_004251 [Chroococcidiopsis sp. SAG 2025]|uniref:hypothetical protein n=1 Tax=Chroococcidiopsis sp. SAG 2025 TaxID=171389 RepID=UPI002936E374|nr:hypothetical protein [Chroococcidiopsis sp. SAG 2025]MDV2994597.1 hypothetical protein [Chroococcidiopsis sp. SAG 2025]
MNKLSHNCIPKCEFACDRNLIQALWNNGAIALLLLVGLTACNMTNSDGSNTGTQISEITDRPNANLIGKTVTVNGEVEEVISSKAFIIEGERFFNDPELLVLNLSDSPIVNDSNIQVTGTIRQFSKSEIENQFDLNLAQELEVKFKGKPVLIAKAVVLTPEPGELAEEPSPFMGKTVTLKGKVEKVISHNAFTLDDEEFIGGKELLVVGTMPAISSIDAGETVRVTGLIRQFVAAEIEKDLDIKLQSGLKVEYEGKAVAIARSVEIVK